MTAIRMLLGMIRPTGWRARLFGVPVGQCGASRWARTGYVVETPSSYPDLTVAETLPWLRNCAA
jgi:ABC-2 type transport system ATP-binding protein